MDKNQKRVAVLSVSSLLLVAMVVAAAIGLFSSNSDDDNSHDVSTSTKAIKTMCQSVDYQDTCIKGLSSKEYNQTDDPKELVKIGFEVSMKQIKQAIGKSETMQKLEQDPRTKEALRSCSDLANLSIRDLERSFKKFSDLDISELNVILGDLKVWLSGAMTYEETCLDGFQNTTGDAADKMKEALKLGKQMTTNALAMITELASAFASINAPPTPNRRRLLFYPEWIEPIKRELIEGKPDTIHADVVVAQDGSGKYKTINEALKDIPKANTKVFVIHIKAGVYEEKVEILSSMTHVLMLGDGPDKTKITGKLNVVDGTTTYRSATVAVHGDYFIAKDIGFENTAGAVKEQAVALRVSADKTIFYNCRMDGYQDTLYTHAYRQYYRDCVITGTIDFVFGDAAVLFQNCAFLVRRPLENQRCIVTAQGRKNVRQPTGIVLQNCTIAADASLEPVMNKVETYLARPWKEYSRTVIMESYLDELIMPKGYLPWNETFALNTLFYTEFNNRGPSSYKDNRINWPGIKELTSDRIKRFTATRFIDGDLWIPRTKVPYVPGLMLPPPTSEPTAASPVSQEEDADFNHTQSNQQQNDLQSALKSPPSSSSPSKQNDKTPASGSGSSSTPKSGSSSSSSSSSDSSDSSSGSTSGSSSSSSGSSSSSSGSSSSSSSSSSSEYDSSSSDSDSDSLGSPLPSDFDFGSLFGAPQSDSAAATAFGPSIASHNSAPSTPSYFEFTTDASTPESNIDPSAPSSSIGASSESSPGASALSSDSDNSETYGPAPASGPSSGSSSASGPSSASSPKSSSGPSPSSGPSSSSGPSPAPGPSSSSSSGPSSSSSSGPSSSSSGPSSSSSSGSSSSSSPTTSASGPSTAESDSSSSDDLFDRGV